MRDLGSAFFVGGGDWRSEDSCFEPTGEVGGRPRIGDFGLVPRVDLGSGVRALFLFDGLAALALAFCFGGVPLVPLPLGFKLASILAVLNNLASNSLLLKFEGSLVGPGDGSRLRDGPLLGLLDLEVLLDLDLDTATSCPGNPRIIDPLLDRTLPCDLAGESDDILALRELSLPNSEPERCSVPSNPFWLEVSGQFELDPGDPSGGDGDVRKGAADSGTGGRVGAGWPP